MSGGADIIDLTADSPHKRAKIFRGVLQKECSSQGSEDVLIVERPPSPTEVCSAGCVSGGEDDDLIITGVRVTVSGIDSVVSVIYDAIRCHNALLQVLRL